MADSFLTEEAKAYGEWADKFLERTEALPRADYETHEGAMAAYKILKRVNKICFSICLIIVAGMVLAFGFSSDMSTWAINYSGEFMQITPSRVDN